MKTEKQIEAQVNALFDTIPFRRELFSDRKMIQIRYGFISGLTAEQIGFYADPRYDWQQMLQLRHGFENGLTTEQVSLYANPRFTPGQMERIRYGFSLERLSTEQTRLYARPEFSNHQMEAVRHDLESGLPASQIIAKINGIRKP